MNVEHDRSLIVSYNYTITPKMVNEFRFGFTNSLINTSFPIQGATADNQLGLTGISFANHPNTGAFPTFNFSDGTGFTPIGRDKDGPGQSKTMQFTDNLSRTMGKHTLRVGHRRPPRVLRDRGPMGPIGRFRRIYVQPGRLHGQFIRRFPAGRAQHGFYCGKQSQHERAERSMGSLRAGSMAGKRSSDA